MCLYVSNRHEITEVIDGGAIITKYLRDSTAEQRQPFRRVKQLPKDSEQPQLHDRSMSGVASDVGLGAQCPLQIAGTAGELSLSLHDRSMSGVASDVASGWELFLDMATSKAAGIGRPPRLCRPRGGENCGTNSFKKSR